MPLFVRHIGHRSTVRWGSCPRSQSFKVSETESDSPLFLQSTDCPQQTIFSFLFQFVDSHSEEEPKQCFNQVLATLFLFVDALLIYYSRDLIFWTLESLFLSPSHSKGLGDEWTKPLFEVGSFFFPGDPLGKFLGRVICEAGILKLNEKIHAERKYPTI